ncbi:MAG: hypothetical protein JNK02_10115 [Planctomycetes bacterium]|nr:hypothetical protein [Planctomycetota bacterium]
MNDQHTESSAPRGPGPLAWVGIALLFAATGALSLAAAAMVAEPAATPAARPATPPKRLADTGLYADFATRTIAADVLPFTPQYPLWTDGATKARWIRLPPGSAIDASDPDVWRFPIGTKLWKEFSFGARVETRTMERGPDGAWVFAAYVWSADGSDAVLADERGVRGVATSAFGTRHDVPSVADCGACHAAGPNAVLGFSGLQLSADRDPLAPHREEPAPGAVFLDDLVERGLVRGLPRSITDTPPRIAAATARERAALGYLHGNCGGCHTAQGALASLGLELDYPLAGARRRAAPAIRSTLGRISRWQPLADASHPRVEPGVPDHSTLARRIGSRSPVAAMPPLGTRAVDADAVALIRAWIESDLEHAASTNILSQLTEKSR